MIQFNDARQPRFAPGCLVQHRRYGYRGVVVDSDMRCRANEDWYRCNRTQPGREQPWHFVLVDGSGHATYAAECNLEEDPCGEPIRHPLLPLFFNAFDGGSYVRNQRVWQGWEGCG